MSDIESEMESDIESERSGSIIINFLLISHRKEDLENVLFILSNLNNHILRDKKKNKHMQVLYPTLCECILIDSVQVRSLVREIFTTYFSQSNEISFQK